MKIRIKEWSNFIETGEVEKPILESICNKIKQNKPLTNKEIAIYQAKAQEIENLLRKR